ncbi:MAG: 1-phosphofructokinase family hexose kinase [Anaerorhabdus sp.]
MIYTCTLNPSLDYFMELNKEIEFSKTNRSQLEYYEAGGKGINVSIVLSNLMIPSRAFGFLGGFTKDFYISLLQRNEYLQPSFTYIDGHTRINVKAKDSNHNIDLNSAGPIITSSNMEHLKKKISRLDENDILVFSGSVLSYLEESSEDIIKTCIDNGVRVVLDTSSNLTKNCLEYKPILICPEIENLEEITGIICDCEEKIIEAGKKCFSLGAQNVMIYLKHDPALFISADGVFKAKTIKRDGKSIDTVGTQDAMVAGFVMSLLRTKDTKECFRYANCCKEATLFTKNLEIRNDINDIYKQLEVEQIQ